MADQDVERVQIDTLSDDQRDLLEKYLQGADIPHELTARTVTVPEDRADDLYSALSIVARAAPSVEEIDLDDGPPSPTARPPIIPERPRITGGRIVASRIRRVGGGAIDWLIITGWGLLAHSAGAPRWAIESTLALYVIVVTALFGRTLGKVVVGIMVVAAHTGRMPGWLRSTIRWAVVSWYSVVVVFVRDLPTAVDIAALGVLVITYVPILWDRKARGLHDRAADTVVVNARV